MNAPAPEAARSPAPTPARTLSSALVWRARLLALGADALQILLFPLFAEGFASPLDWAVDIAMWLAMVRMLGLHWAFLPSFAAEIVPGLALVPTWSAAVWIASAARRGEPLGRWALALIACGLVLAAAVVVLILRLPHHLPGATP